MIHKLKTSLQSLSVVCAIFSLAQAMEEQNRDLDLMVQLRQELQQEAITPTVWIIQEGYETQVHNLNEDTHDIRQLMKGLPDGPYKLTALGITERNIEKLLRLLESCDGNVSTIILSGCKIGDIGAEMIAAHSLSLPNLKILELPANNIGNAGATALANSNLNNLQRLNLRNNLIEDTGAIDIAKSHSFIGLKHLELGYNNIGPAGILAIGNSQVLTSLTHLGLRLNMKNIRTFDKAKAIVRLANLTNLRSLVI